MSYTPYRDMENLLRRRLKIKGNSCYSSYDHANYEVWSYRAKILEVNHLGVVVYFDNRIYSRATERLQRLIARAYTLPRLSRKVYYGEIKKKEEPTLENSYPNWSKI